MGRRSLITPPRELSNVVTNDRNTCFRDDLLNDDTNIRITGRSFLSASWRIRQDDKAAATSGGNRYPCHVNEAKRGDICIFAMGR